MNLREMALSPGRVDALDPPRLRLSVELQSLALASVLPRVTVQIDWHSGPRAELRPLFELADDSRANWTNISNWGGSLWSFAVGWRSVISSSWRRRGRARSSSRTWPSCRSGKPLEWAAPSSPRPW